MPQKPLSRASKRTAVPKIVKRDPNGLKSRHKYALQSFGGLAAALFLSLIWSPQPRGPARRMLLWLSFAFNALVASGYLIVGGATGFGDWGVLLDRVHPAALWRIPAVLAPFRTNYAVSPDGQRFLVNSVTPEAAPAAITIAVNWQERWKK